MLEMKSLAMFWSHLLGSWPVALAITLIVIYRSSEKNRLHPKSSPLASGIPGYRHTGLLQAGGGRIADREFQLLRRSQACRRADERAVAPSVF